MLDLVHHCVLHALGNLPIYDNTDAYVMRQENDHYVYHNAVMITIRTGYLKITLENAIPTRKGIQEVCKLIVGTILACAHFSLFLFFYLFH